MEALVPLLVLVLFSLLAFRFGHDSRPNARSQERKFADAGFLIDNETTTVMPDAPASATPPASESGGRAYGFRTG
jgi:hypothetical protein